MKVYVFDLDGTIAPIERGVPAALAAGLRQLEKRGQVAVCSGKPVYYLCGLLRQLELAAPVMIGENGAAVQFGVGLPPERVGSLPVSSQARDAMAELRRWLEERFAGRLWFQPNEYSLTPFPYDAELFAPIRERLSKADVAAAGLTVYEHSDCFDIVPSGVDKGAGVRMLCEMLGVSPAEVTAVGDHTNDIPMFRQAGRAIAVGGFSPAEAQLCFESAMDAVEYLLSEKEQGQILPMV